jgi:hypothetical protein
VAGLAAGTVASVARTVRRGSQLREWYLTDRALLPPEARKYVDALNAGGGRINMEPFYRSTAAGPFVRSLGELGQMIRNPMQIAGELGQMFRDAPGLAKALVPFRIAGRALETMSEPLMGYLVPRAKLGVFYDMAEDYMRRNPNASQAELSAAMTKAWDSVDNRLGQMVYDNVFWHKAQKDLSFIAVRSVGWNLGTIRELAGAGVDAAQMLRGGGFTHRMAYAIMLPVLSALYGGVLTYLMTGRAPQSLLDYFYPQDGRGGRLSIPGYMKDVFAYASHPVQTLLNKLHPLFETAAELYQNRDYYGGIIAAPGANPASEYFRYLTGQLEPFALRAMQRQHATGGGSTLDDALSFWGIQPAPAGIANPERVRAFQLREDMKALAKRRRNEAKGLTP